jgi:hypothetical protein
LGSRSLSSIFLCRLFFFSAQETMALGIIEPKKAASAPGTVLLVDNAETNVQSHHEHSRVKHGTGKV